jgi:hypothetical protein
MLREHRLVRLQVLDQRLRVLPHPLLLDARLVRGVQLQRDEDADDDQDELTERIPQVAGTLPLDQQTGADSP